MDDVSDKNTTRSFLIVQVQMLHSPRLYLLKSHHAQESVAGSLSGGIESPVGESLDG